MSLPLTIAKRYFRSKKGYLFVSFLNLVAVCGVTLGIFAMVVVMSVMTGFSKDLRAKLLGLNAHIRLVDKSDKPIADTATFREELNALIGASSVSNLLKYVDGEVIIQPEGETSEMAAGARVRGLEFSDLSKIPSMEYSPEVEAQGEKIFAKDSEGTAGAIIGSELVQYLGIFPDFESGAVVRLTAPFGSIDPTGNLSPNVRLFRLNGGFRSGYYDYDAKYILLSVEDATKLLGQQARSGFSLWLKDPDSAQTVAAKLQTAFGDRFEIKGWFDENKKLFRALKLERIGMSFLLGLIILIASFSIVSVVLMLVFAKQKDIGMLSALGLDRSGIQKIFIYKGLMIGLLGTAVGMSLGFGLCYVLKTYPMPLPSSYYLDYLPVDLKAWHFVVTGCAGVAMAVFASVYPARQAMRVSTTTVLRYE